MERTKPRSAARPLVALTMGDPAGIGPEICARALADESVAARRAASLYCDERVMRKAAAVVGVDRRRLGRRELVDLANADPASFVAGRSLRGLRASSLGVHRGRRARPPSPAARGQGFGRSSPRL